MLSICGTKTSCVAATTRGWPADISSHCQAASPTGVAVAVNACHCSAAAPASIASSQRESSSLIASPPLTVAMPNLGRDASIPGAGTAPVELEKPIKARSPVASRSFTFERSTYIESFFSIGGRMSRGSISRKSSPSRHIRNKASSRPFGVQKPANRAPAAEIPWTSLVSRLCRNGAASSPLARINPRSAKGATTVPSRAVASSPAGAPKLLASAASPELASCVIHSWVMVCIRG